MPARSALLALLLLLGSFPAPARGAVPPAPLKPLKTDRPPVIDGRLDDAVWKEAPSVTGFETFIPDFGKRQPEQTVAYMAYDRDNLYFAFRCFDDQPEKIKAAVSRRDDVQGDDFVCLNLDSFNDQQSLYAFYVNPLGIQGDSRFASNKEDYSVDMVWKSAGRIDEQGYCVEMQIPLKSIRYAHGERVVMGVFFERTINRRQEHGSYPALDPKRGYAFLTQMAPLEYTGLNRYTLLEVLPATTFGRRSEAPAGRLVRQPDSSDFSLTGKYGLTSSLVLDAAINPDFSQIEADAGQIDANLRYGLFYPEKRPFFLEGSETFNLAAAATSPLQTVVHTRTIVDPKAGFKLSGKIGRSDTVAAILALDGSPSAAGAPDAPDASFVILRYRRTTRQDGYMGLFYTDREQGGRSNRVFGPDGQLRLGQSGVLSFHALGSSTREAEGAPRTTGRALSLEYYHDTDSLVLTASFQDIGRGFQADAGYLTRTGLTRFGFSLSPRFYPASGFLRRISPIFSAAALRDQASGLVEDGEQAGLTAVFRGNATLTASFIHATEIFLGRRFQASGFTLTGRTQLTKRLSLSLTFRTGAAIRYTEDPFQGRGTRAGLTAVYQPSENINLSLGWSYADLYRSSTGEKVYDYGITRGRLTYQINRYLFLRAIAEYNSFRRSLLTDFLASFTYIPGTVVFVGYGSLYQKLAWEEELGLYRDSGRFFEMQRGFFFKASYLWRL